MMLTDDELTAMRATQEAALPETIYVQRLTRTPDGAGGWSEAWTTVATIKGRLAEEAWKDAEQEVAGRYGALYKVIVTLPSDTELTESDRLQCNGTQYQVIGIARRSSKTALRVSCVEVR
jgi:head-tail adaptor